MKEIKFRGKYEGNWWYVRVSDEHTSGSWEQFWTLVDKKTVGQYIGYQDKHKADIYAGDILQDPFDNRQEVVSFVDEYHILSGWTLRPIKRDALAGDYFTTHPSWLLGAEVIGNIYANPEMLSAEVK